jgi:hypothetical protein
VGKLDILSRESGDSPWEGEMKHRQNRGHILLPAQICQVNTAKVLELQVDKELLKEIKLKTARDLLMQEVIIKLRNGE